MQLSLRERIAEELQQERAQQLREQFSYQAYVATCAQLGGSPKPFTTFRLDGVYPFHDHVVP